LHKGLFLFIFKSFSDVDMFDELVQKLDSAMRKLRGLGKITEKNIADSMREIRRVLLEADVNYKVAKDFIAKVQSKAVGQEVIQSIAPGQQVVKIVNDEMVQLLGKANEPIQFGKQHPTVIMVVGLQGSGKTTFVGKLGCYLRKQGRHPLLVAADVYRPAAVQQLQTLGKSADMGVFCQAGQNPLKIARDAVAEAKKNQLDTVILDTAGRLHIDNEMMSELATMKTAIQPAEILFVADSMTGQDAVRSATAFQEQLDYEGIVLTKLDGDAKGGAALSMTAITGKPIKFVSNSENLNGLEPFYPDRMALRILGMGDVVTLVEKAQKAVDREEAAKLEKKLRKQEFTLEDFYGQLQQIKRMGSLNQIAAMLPGMGNRLKGLQVDESALTQVEVIIGSMTFEERRKPHIINGSRRKRIAMGSGTRVQDVNRLLKQFQMMQNMMKQMGKFGSKRIPQNIPFAF
jgi:signal recognition particle subunit SRP54